jgi:hypothetical protein
MGPPTKSGRLKIPASRPQRMIKFEMQPYRSAELRRSIERRGRRGIELARMPLGGRIHGRAGMTLPNANQVWLNALTADHGDMRRLICGCDGAMERLASPTGADAVGELRRFLDQLRCEVQRRFERERDGGYLDQAVAMLPRLGPWADELTRQHGRLARALEDLTAMASQSHVDHGRFERAYRAFREQFAQHEADEAAILQEAHI